jgi:hypothetical protein
MTMAGNFIGLIIALVALFIWLLYETKWLTIRLPQA